jgi:hypothetical protein
MTTRKATAKAKAKAKQMFFGNERREGGGSN